VRVEAFLSAIKATATPAPVRPLPIPLPRVEPVLTDHGTVWQLDEASRARLQPATVETNALPMHLVRLLVQP
jgi:hypothetical protein